MIRVETAQAALELATELERSGLSVTPSDSSLMNLLNTSSFLDTNRPLITAETEITAEAISRDSCVIPEFCNSSPHDEALDDAVTEIAEATINHLNFAKNVVRPIVSDLAERVENALQSMPTVATFNPDLVQFDLPELAYAGVFAEKAEQFSANAFEMVVGGLGAPLVSSDEEVLAMMNVGNRVIDEQLAVWAATCGDHFLTDVYNVVFGTMGSSSGTTATSLMSSVETGASAALAVMVVGSKLIDNPPQGLNSTLSNWKRDVSILIGQAALRVRQACEDRARMLSIKQLFISQTKDRVCVFKPVYQEWLDNGGQPAAIFGALLSGRHYLTAESITTDAASLIDLWKSHNTMLTGSLQANRYLEAIKRIRFHTEAVLGDHLNEIFGDRYGSNTLSMDHPAVMETRRLALEYIDSLSLNQITDIWSIALEVVAKRFFFFTSAFEILKGVEDHAKANPGIQASEAALLSSIDYVLDFVIEGLVIKG